MFQIKLIEGFWRQSGVLHRGYLTAQVFADPDDTRMVLFPSCYMDRSRMAEYLGDAVEPQHLNEFIA